MSFPSLVEEALSGSECGSDGSGGEDNDDFHASFTLTSIRKRTLNMTEKQETKKKAKPVSPVKTSSDSKESSVLDALLIMRRKEADLELRSLEDKDEEKPRGGIGNRQYQAIQEMKRQRHV